MHAEGFHCPSCPTNCGMRICHRRLKRRSHFHLYSWQGLDPNDFIGCRIALPEETCFISSAVCASSSSSTFSYLQRIFQLQKKKKKKAPLIYFLFPGNTCLSLILHTWRAIPISDLFTHNGKSSFGRGLDDMVRTVNLDKHRITSSNVEEKVLDIYTYISVCMYVKRKLNRRSEASVLAPRLGKKEQISMIGFKTSSVSNERAACVNVAFHSFHLRRVVFVHLCAIKGFAATRSGGPAAPVWLRFPLTRPAGLKQLRKRHGGDCKNIPLFSNIAAFFTRKIINLNNENINSGRLSLKIQPVTIFLKILSVYTNDRFSLYSQMQI